jgi:hypothetical protein
MGTDDKTDIVKVAGRTPPTVTERVVVGLVSEAAYARDRLKARTGLNAADVNNRALQLYDAIDEELYAGAELLLEYPSGRVAAVRITVDPKDLRSDPPAAVSVLNATATLTDWGVEARGRIAARRGFSNTDILNQALQVYDRIDEERKFGATVRFRYPDGSIKTMIYK